MSYSFDIKTSMDLFNELSKRVEEYNKNPMSSGNAVICAILCWHVVEWIYQEYREQLSAYNTNQKFQEFMKEECVSLCYMQDIANGSKHRGITRYTPIVKKTKKHNSGGAYSNAYSNAYSSSPCLQMELDEGQVVSFDEEIQKAKSFLDSFIKSNLNE